MTNYFIDLKDLITSDQSTKTQIGEIVVSSGNKKHVRLHSNNTIVAWGNGEIGNTVMVKDGTIVAVVNKEDIPVVYVN